MGSNQPQSVFYRRRYKVSGWRNTECVSVDAALRLAFKDYEDTSWLLGKPAYYVQVGFEPSYQRKIIVGGKRIGRKIVGGKLVMDHAQISEAYAEAHDYQYLDWG